MTILLSIVFGVLSMTAFAVANAASKTLSQQLGPARTLFLRGFAIMLVLGSIAIPQLPHHHDPKAMILTVLLGVAGYIPVLSFTHAIRESRLGIVAPIAGTSPLITLLAAYLFLGAKLHPGQWVAAIVIILANIAMSVDIKNWRNSHFSKAASGIPFAFVASLGWGLFFFLLVYSIRALGPWVATWLAELGVIVAAGVHSFTQGKPPLNMAIDRSVFLNGLLICVGTLSFSLGARYYNVAIVAALSNSTALLSATLGYFMFQERLNAQEKFAGLAMVAGVAALTIL